MSLISTTYFLFWTFTFAFHGHIKNARSQTNNLLTLFPGEHPTGDTSLCFCYLCSVLTPCTYLVPLLVFSCCPPKITTNLVVKNKTTHIYYLLVVWVRVLEKYSSARSLPWVVRGQIQGVGRSVFLFGGSGDESLPKLIQIVGRISFQEFRSLFPCWLSGRGLFLIY